ncbi:hypothetical protein LB505_006796 [Fusarium chuoi]|nr:hypothetical protein LB505_006796 [Fusarium chuoi]
MNKFFELYFTGQVDLNADALEIFEYRHDWATFNFTSETFNYLLFNFFPDVILHLRSQDEEQRKRSLRLVPRPTNDLHLRYYFRP